jgi:hypothetical protein
MQNLHFKIEGTDQNGNPVRNIILSNEQLIELQELVDTVNTELGNVMTEYDSGFSAGLADTALKRIAEILGLEVSHD